MKETFKIRDLEQVRLLADPLKLKLLQAFAESAKTTKQVAEELGENVTKLYRHVDNLHDAGLLAVVEEKQKRGTIERTFRAVAQRFEADHSLFSGDAGADGTDAVRKVLRAGEAEILNVLANAETGDEEEAIILRIRGKASPEKVAELRTTLVDWIETLPSGEPPSIDDGTEFGGMIAFYEIK